MFDEDVQQFTKKISYLEMHPNLQCYLLTFVKGKGQVRFQYNDMLPDKLMGEATAQDNLG